MSYILEALKKAQAERQLGEVPSVHAASMPIGSEPPAGGRLTKPMLAAMVVMAGVIVVLLALVWRNNDGGRPAPAATAPAALASAAPGTPVVAAAPAAPSAPAPQFVVQAPAPLAPPKAPAPAVQPAVVAEAARAAAAPVSAPVKAPAPAAAAPEEVTQSARDLPEPIQRALPTVAIGGYIYSKDPADRLLLVDKVLRHEGEEVAPGLVLEKLQPKAAIFSFKGYRYRVPY